MPLAPPNTIVQLSHALTIIGPNNAPIGAIIQWNVGQDRGIAELYEFGQVTRPGLGNGDPFEKTPNNITGMTISVNRYDLYTSKMERAFGTPDITMLSRQNDPLELREQWVSPNNQTNYYVLYRGVWFSNVGRQLSTTGDRQVIVNATLHYTSREEVTTT